MARIPPLLPGRTYHVYAAPATADKGFLSSRYFLSVLLSDEHEMATCYLALI